MPIDGFARQLSPALGGHDLHIRGESPWRKAADERDRKMRLGAWRAWRIVL